MADRWESEDGKVLLIRGDCREIIPALAKVETVVTDPVWPNASVKMAGQDDPYGLFQQMWESFAFVPDRAAIQLGCDSDPRFLAPVPLPFFRYVTMELSRKGYKGRLLVSGDMGFLFGEPPRSRPGLRVIPGKCNDPSSKGQETEHPCPRKLRHVEFLVENWTNPEDTVLDPFLGSGTTAVACIRLKRKVIGIEIDQGFFGMAMARAKRELRSPMLQMEV